MPAYEIEIILNRQVADSYTIPVFITDTIGNLIYYNRPAEEVLGKRYEETGEMPVEEWSTIFTPMDESGELMSPEELPLVKALKNYRPYHDSFWIKSLTGKLQKISNAAYPIIDNSSKFLGAVAIFWELTDE